MPDSTTATACPASIGRLERLGVMAMTFRAMATATAVMPTSTSPSSRWRYHSMFSIS